MAEDIKAIDVMNYPFTADMQKKMWTAYEWTLMQKEVFHLDHWVMKIYENVGEFVAEMDELGYEKVFLCGPKIFSYRDHKLITDVSVDEIWELVKQAPDRLVGMASYDPFRISESLSEMEKAVKEYGFKGIYAHTFGQQVPYDDRRMYPCYAKCVELGIPFSCQVGHSLEILPSEVGHPIRLDMVALDFPELTIVGSHTGWPWCEEMVAMAWKHLNVYVDISAHMPRYLDPYIKQFMDTRGRNKVLFGTNGLGLKNIKDQFMELQIKDETKRKVLRENAIKVYKL